MVQDMGTDTELCQVLSLLALAGDPQLFLFCVLPWHAKPKIWRSLALDLSFVVWGAGLAGKAVPLPFLSPLAAGVGGCGNTPDYHLPHPEGQAASRASFDPMC